MVPRTLLVTNDFPPRPGGIQAYLHALSSRLPAGELVVYTSSRSGSASWDAGAGFPVHRDPGALLLPVPAVAGRVVALAREHGCDAVWFGAAAPLGLLAPALRRRAGVATALASAHGHEVGWTRVPGGRVALRRIARRLDRLTAVSGYVRDALAAAIAPLPAPVHLAPGVDTGMFRPDRGARDELRGRHRLGTRPVVSCVARLVRRKGQDMLIKAWPAISARVPGAVLLVVGGGPDAGRLRRLAASHGVAEQVVFVGTVPWELVPAYHAVGDVFAMPSRSRVGGVDLEGLGLAGLEASAAGLPVVVGDSGGAPETVRPGETGLVVDGRSQPDVAEAVGDLLADPDRAARMGAAGRDWMSREWQWSSAVRLLRGLLGAAGSPTPIPGEAGDRRADQE